MQALLVDAEALDVLAGGWDGCGHGGEFSMGFCFATEGTEGREGTEKAKDGFKLVLIRRTIKHCFFSGNVLIQRFIT